MSMKQKALFAAGGLGFTAALLLHCIVTYMFAYPVYRYPYAHPLSVITGFAAGIVCVALLVLMLCAVLHTERPLRNLPWMFAAAVLGAVAGIPAWGFFKQFAGEIIHVLFA